jgi:hypothetical protein
MSNPTSNYNWQMPTATDLVTDLPADFEVFGQAVDTAMADLLGGTSGQILSKNSNTNMDFVWTTPVVEVSSWTTYSPTLTNLTVGNGTQIARYQKVGKTVNVFYQLTLGSTSSVGNTPNITLPSTPAQANFYAGSLNMIDSGNTTFMGQALIVAGALYPQAIQSNGTYTNAANVTSTVPMTWTTSDVLTMAISYEES